MKLLRTVGLALGLIGLTGATAQADLVDLGSITFTGSFTRNGAFDPGQPQGEPLGSFTELIVQSATGLYQPHVSSGSILGMNSSHVPGSGAPSSSVLWDIGGFIFDTTWLSVTGPDFAKHILGLCDLTGHGFDPVAWGLGAFTYWSFVSEMGGSEIILTIRTRYQTPVPDTGRTAALLSVGLIGLWAWRLGIRQRANR